MHDNCAKSQAPFEVLIQGPVGSRFVRSLLPMESFNESSDPKKRSTISIFHPDENKEIYGYDDNDRKLIKRESESETPAKAAAAVETEAKQDVDNVEAAEPTVAESNDKESPAADASKDIASCPAEKVVDAPCDGPDSPKAEADHKVKRDVVENIAEIEAKAEDAEKDAEDKQVGQALPFAPLLPGFPIGDRFSALRAQLETQRG